MEHFDADFVPNGSDNSARYSYQQQPSMCEWNLRKFAEALSPLLSAADAQAVLTQYPEMYERRELQLMRQKFGLLIDSSSSSNSALSDRQFVNSFFDVMSQTSTDFTDAFVALTEFVEAVAVNSAPGAAGTRTDIDTAIDTHKSELLDKLLLRTASPANLIAALKRKLRIHRLGMHPEQINQLWTLLETEPQKLSEMFGGAPISALRQEFEGEKKKLDMALKISADIKKLEMSTPEIKLMHDRVLWTAWIDQYIARLRQEDELLHTPNNNNNNDNSIERPYTNRVQLMRQANPTFVLRNWIAQDAIASAENGERPDYTPVRTVLQMLQTPFNPNFSTFRNGSGARSVSNTPDDSSGDASWPCTDIQKKYVGTPPEWAESLICTCSS